MGDCLGASTPDEAAAMVARLTMNEPLLPWPELSQDMAFIAFTIRGLRAELDAVRTREQAARPVLDAAVMHDRYRAGEDYFRLGKTLAEINSDLYAATAAYRAALSGSAEAESTHPHHRPASRLDSGQAETPTGHDVRVWQDGDEWVWSCTCQASGRWGTEAAARDAAEGHRVEADEPEPRQPLFRYTGPCLTGQIADPAADLAAVERLIAEAPVDYPGLPLLYRRRDEMAAAPVSLAGDAEADQPEQTPVEPLRQLARQWAFDAENMDDRTVAVGMYRAARDLIDHLAAIAIAPAAPAVAGDDTQQPDGPHTSNPAAPPQHRKI